MKWLQLTIPISPQIEDACVNRVHELDATAVFTDSSPGSTLSFLHGIFPLEANREWIEQAIRIYLASLQDLGFEVPDLKFTIREIDEDDYLYRWKEYFQPIHFADTLVVEPVWDIDHARPGEKVLRIDPGMAFGTGQHFTTQFCLEWICEHKDHLNSLADLGCGSGILSIAASLLGVKQVVALDHDPLAMHAALQGMMLNRIQKGVFLIAADVLSLPLKGTFDAVIANLHTSLLLQVKEILEALLRPGASLVLTGIGYARQQEVLKRYSSLRLQTIQEDPQKEWVGIWYTK
ncbi:MAG: 50S ribosomal protein L11 methyltransferase [bacterium]